MLAYCGHIAHASSLTLTKAGLLWSSGAQLSFFVTQGDTLSMFMYAIGTLPLIGSLRDLDVTQIW